MTDPQDVIREILRKAYQIEVDGYTFYSMTAERASKPAVQELFEKLAQDEVAHKAYLRDIMKHYDQEGPSAFHLEHRTPDLKAFTDTIFTEKFREQARGAAFELSVLSIGMQLESNAIAYFSGAARTAGDQEVRSFYEFLADWERKHLEALQNLHGVVRAEFWEQGGFAPF